MELISTYSVKIKRERKGNKAVVTESDTEKRNSTIKTLYDKGNRMNQEAEQSILGFCKGSEDEFS